MRSTYESLRRFQSPSGRPHWNQYACSYNFSTEWIYFWNCFDGIFLTTIFYVSNFILDIMKYGCEIYN